MALIALFFASQPSFAGTDNTSTFGNPSVRLFYPEDYGQHHQNWAINTGPRGHIYVANGAGVLVFDGVRWDFLGTPGGNTWVFGLDLTPDGRIVLGTMEDFGHFEADGASNWRYVSLAKAYGLSDLNMVRRAVFHPAATFFATKENLYWHKEMGGIGNVAVNQAKELFSLDNEIFVTDADGLWRFDFGQEKLQPALADGDLLADKVVTSLVPMPDGKILLATRESGLFKLDGDRLTPLLSSANQWMRRNQVTRVLVLPDGQMLVGSRRDGLLVLDENGDVLRYVGKKEGLPWPRITGITQDHQKGIWLSCEGGIARIELDSGVTFFSENKGIHGGVEMITRHAGSLFVATLHGLFKLEPGVKGQAAQFTQIADQTDPIWSILSVDSELLLSDSKGITTLDFNGAGLEPVKSRIYTGNRAVNMIRSVSDPTRVYAALANGVLQLQRAKQGWISHGKLPGIDEHTQYVLEDAQATLWVSTLRQHLYKVTQTQSWPNSEVQNFSAESGLPDSKIHLFNIDDRITVDTDFGVYKWSGNEFARDPQFSVDRPLHRARQVDNGEVWSSRGVLRLNKDNSYRLEPSVYRFFPFGSIAALFTEENLVWLGKNNVGIIRVDRNLISEPSPPKRPSIRRILETAGKRIVYGGAIGKPRPQTFRLDPEQSDLRFLYALADYATPKKTRYRHRLLGLNDRWSEWSDDTQADFTNLPGGQFQFELQVKDASQQLSKVSRFAFTKQPYWYLSSWALIGYFMALILLFATSAYYGQRWRTRRLEVIIDKRTATIRHQKEEIEQMSEAKLRFFANVSHEFRTPLTLTIGPLDDLLSDERIGLAGPAKRYVELARDNARRSLGLLGEILDINQLAEQRFRLHISDTDIAQIALSVCQRFDDLARRHDIELRSDGLDRAIHAPIDAQQIDRCLSNLLSNAVKFTPPGGQIRLVLALQDQRIELTVTDSGPGIAEEEKSLIFERYYQSKNNALSHAGTGIGLALVKDLMALHGGSVTVTSEIGKGSRFSLILPLTATVSDHHDPSRPFLEEADLGNTPPEIETEPTKVLLIVDDNAELREFLRMRLCTQYRILEAADGIFALKAIAEELPDLIISDVMMPNMDGIELTQSLRKNPELAHIPLLLLTAKGTKRDTVQGLQIGANDYLSKPFDTSELIARVNGLLSNQQRLRKHLRLEMQQTKLELHPKKEAFAQNFAAAVSRRLADGNIQLDQLAEDLCVDRSTLFRRVQQHFSRTPVQYIRDKRLALAAELLKAGRGSISEIAYAVGFESLNYFSRCYRQAFSVAPSEHLKSSTAPNPLTHTQRPKI